MQFYKLIIAYSGTRYYGWQEQPNRITVSGVLRQKFQAIFKHKPLLVGASRTDAGVHALGQVVRVGTSMDIDLSTFLRAWQHGLPHDISIRSLTPIQHSFHPQHNVVQKVYYYHFFLKRPLPFFAAYGFYHRLPLDKEKLRDCLEIFRGTHDFRSFCTGYDREDTVRTIDHLSLESFPRFDAYQIVIKGKSFLHFMIRRIVGACLDIASSPLKPEALLAAVRNKHPRQLFFNAPAHGLLLRKILYEKD